MTWGVNDYAPARNPRDPRFDIYGWAWRQCCSFCNWRMRRDLGLAAGLWHNALQWAASSGRPHDGNPRVHDIMCLQPGMFGAGPYGHVAMVLGVRPGWVDVEQYDWNYLSYSRGSFPSRGPQFIHLVGAAPAPAPVPAPTGPSYGTIFPTSFYCRVHVPAGEGAHVRAGPGLGFPITAPDLPRGYQFHCDAYAYGTGIPDKSLAGWPIDHRWYRRAHLQWVASALVDGNAPGSHP